MTPQSSSLPPTTQAAHEHEEGATCSAAGAQEMLEFLYKLTQSNADPLSVNHCEMDAEEEERARMTADCVYECMYACMCVLAGQSGCSPSSCLGVDETQCGLRTDLARANLADSSAAQQTNAEYREHSESNAQCVIVPTKHEVSACITV